MQRAAASTPSATPQMPRHSQVAEPRPSKRQKTSRNPSPVATPNLDLHSLQSTLGEEEQKRGKAGLAEDAGETKWVLYAVDEGLDNVKSDLRVTAAGFSEIDEVAWEPGMLGRRSFGNFDRELEVGLCYNFIQSQPINRSISQGRRLIDTIHISEPPKWYSG